MHAGFLAAFVVRVLPLCGRHEHIPELFAHLSSLPGQRMGRPFARPSPDVVHALQEYAWPGNVRALQNAVQRAPGAAMQA